MSNLSNQNNNVLSFDSLLANIKQNAKTNAALEALDNSNKGVLDIERVAFGSTNIGKQNPPTKLFKSPYFQWHAPGDKDRSEVVDNMKILAVRGFILKAKDGYSLYGVPDDSPDGAPTTICRTTECTLGEYTYKGSNCSPYPLTKWLTSGKEALHNPSAHLRGLNLKGSRNESCHDCVSAGRNFVYKKDPNGNICINDKTNSPIVDSRCSPMSSILFAVTHVGKQNRKLAEGIEWLDVTKVTDQENVPYTDTPVILNIDLSPALTGAGGDNFVLSKANKDADFVQVGIATMSNGGERFIPDDVKLFYPYWLDLTAQGLVTGAPKNSNFPEHPRLPIIIQAQTELYMSPPAGHVAYAQTLPSFRTSGSLSDPEIFEQWVKVLNLYVETYMNYMSNNDIQVDQSYKLAGSMPTITASSASTTTTAPTAEFDATVDTQANVYSYNDESDDNVA